MLNFSKIRQRKINTVCNHLYVEPKKEKRKKLANITKKKQTHTYREQISGYQWGEGSRKGQG